MLNFLVDGAESFLKSTFFQSSDADLVSRLISKATPASTFGNVILEFVRMTLFALILRDLSNVCVHPDSLLTQTVYHAQVNILSKKSLKRCKRLKQLYNYVKKNFEVIKVENQTNDIKTNLLILHHKVSYQSVAKVYTTAVLLSFALICFSQDLSDYCVTIFELAFECKCVKIVAHKLL